VAILLLVYLVYAFLRPADGSGGVESSFTVAHLSWLPMLLIIGLWTFFMVRLKPSQQQKLIARSHEHVDKVEAQLETIVDLVKQKKES